MINWNDLQQKYPLAVKRLCDENGWRIDTLAISRMGILKGKIDQRTHPFDVLCALDEEGIRTHIMPIYNNRFFVGIKPGETARPIAVGIAKTRRSGANAAIPHAVKALNDKLEDTK